jgi:glycosyltransferase involved in cell wall biosynthesis
VTVMKWLIVEDALRDRKGHWLEYVSTFVRGLRELGDDVTALCDRKAEGIVMEQTGARPLLPESIWHRMGDRVGALERFARVPGHAIATFFAMRKFFRGLNHRGQREKGGGGGEFSHGGTANTEMGAGLRPGSRAGASESDSLASELADSPVSESLSRSASGTASSLDPGHSSLAPSTAFDSRLSTLDSTPAVPDVIFVPTVLVHHLLGWWLLIRSGSVPKGSRVLLFFPNLPIRLDDSGRPFWTAGPTTKLMAWLFGQLQKEVESGRVILGVETHAMQRALESLIGMRVVYLPHPVEVPAHLAGDRRSEVGDRESIGTTKDTNGHEKLTTEDTESAEDRFVQKQGGAWSSQAGASESDSLASKLADSPVSESRNRAAIGPAEAAEPSRTDRGGLRADFEDLNIDSLNNPPSAISYQPSAMAKPIVFGCYGAARWEKGSDLLQVAIRRVLETNPDIPAKFCLQWLGDFTNESGEVVRLDQWLKNHPKVQVFTEHFKEMEYAAQLAMTSAMILPYRSPYRLRVSRVVIEAMMYGMPVIATKGTTLFAQAEEHGVVVGCEEGDEESLAKTTIKMVANFDQLQRSADAKIYDVQSNFSVDRFRQLLMNQTTKRQMQ